MFIWTVCYGQCPWGSHWGHLIFCREFSSSFCPGMWLWWSVTHSRHFTTLQLPPGYPGELGRVGTGDWRGTFASFPINRLIIIQESSLLLKIMWHSKRENAGKLHICSFYRVFVLLISWLKLSNVWNSAIVLLNSNTRGEIILYES